MKLREAVKNYLMDFLPQFRRGKNPPKTAIFGQKNAILALLTHFWRKILGDFPLVHKNSCFFSGERP